MGIEKTTQEARDAKTMMQQVQFLLARAVEPLESIRLGSLPEVAKRVGKVRVLLADLRPEVASILQALGAAAKSRPEHS